MISRLRREASGGRERADTAKRLSARVEELSGFNSILKSIMKAALQCERDLIVASIACTFRELMVLDSLLFGPCFL